MPETTYKLDEDTLEHLEQVRKGQARRFLMVCKGTSILNLVVYKTGNVEKYRKPALANGHGDLVQGVIEGRGGDVSFKIAAGDGHKEGPVKALVLKSFLEDRGKNRWQPQFEVVPDLPDVAEEKGTAPQSPPQVSPSDDDDEMIRFTARLKDVKPDIDALLKDDDPNDAELKALAGEAANLARQKEFAKANAALDRLEELVEKLEDSSAPPVPPPPPPVTAPDRKLAAALRMLSPAISQAAKAYPERQDEIQKAKQAVEGLLSQQKFDDAAKALAVLEKLLGDLGSASPEVADAFRDQWEAAVEKWETAVETVRGQLAGLQRHLTTSDDEELQSIGEFGLNAVTQKHLVPLTAALLELGATGDDKLKVAARRVKQLTAAFRQHVETSPVVRACDANPFGISITIRQTLGPGLTALDDGLAMITA